MCATRDPLGGWGNLQLLDPLAHFYSGTALPSIVPLDGAEVPEPYRSLLVHSNDMTPTLEAAWRGSLRLRILTREIRDLLLMRQVVLVLERDETPVEYGAIRIHLEHLPAGTRKVILEGKVPLGRILQDMKVAHSSRPLAYFEVQSDHRIGAALELAGPARLFGRRNRLVTPEQEPIAEVVEILPPWPGPAAPGGS